MTIVAGWLSCLSNLWISLAYQTFWRLIQANVWMQAKKSSALS